MSILSIALPVLLNKNFDYLPPTGSDCATLQPGIRVRVPFHGRQLIGILVAVLSTSTLPLHKLKTALAILDTEPVVPADILRLCCWAATYYQYPLGMALTLALPSQLRQGKNLPLAATKLDSKTNNAVTSPLLLNEAQQTIVNAVTKLGNNFAVITIDGVTGSGKTEVYLHVIQQLLHKQRQALVLVPEISLTPQTITYFKNRFDVPIITLHSRLTAKERLLAWHNAQLAVPCIIIGTRSAIFTPLPKLGIIIIDEEHDLSFKQQDSFRYNARDLAIWRARDANIPVILGSATPSLETLHRSWGGRYKYFTLPQRAGSAQPPSFNVIDVRRQNLADGLSTTLIQAITNHLQAGNQALLLLNRRGFAPVMLCHDCGWVAKCQHCDVRLTYHMQPYRLHCHHCDAQQNLPTKCALCGSKELRNWGIGTEKLEISLSKHFPAVNIVRIDRDSTRNRHQFTKVVQGIHNGQFQLIVGTQMIAKGHHFPNVTMAGIIDADYGLFAADFRASERLGQLIMQVAGRAGRGTKPGQVWLQTHHPEHQLLQLLLAGNYQLFAKTLLQERESVGLPPFAAMAIFHASNKNLAAVESFLLKVKALALKLRYQVRVLGPVAALLPKRASRYRWQLLLQAKHKAVLQQFLTQLTSVVASVPGNVSMRWSIDVDPMDML